MEGFTFEFLAKKFLEEHVSKLRSAREMKRSFNQYLLPQFGKTKARELKRSAVRDYLDNMGKTRPVKGAEAFRAHS